MNDQNQKEVVLASAASLPGVRDLLKRTWQVYKKRFWVFLGITIAPFLVVFSLTLIFWGVAFLFGNTGSIKSQLLILWLAITGFILALIINIWSGVSLLYAIKEREAGMGIKAAFQKARHKIIFYWWVSFLSSFIVVGAFLFFIIPGIILGVWFSLATYVLVSEDLKGMNAILRSKQLVSGNWWKVFWRYIVFFIIFAASYFAIVSPLNYFIGKNIGDIASSFVSILFLPLAAVYFFLLYEDLKKLKEGIAPEPVTRGRKIKYILVGLAGFLLVAVIITIVSALRFFRGLNAPL